MRVEGLGLRVSGLGLREAFPARRKAVEPLW